MKYFLLPSLILIFSVSCGNGGQGGSESSTGAFRQVIDFDSLTPYGTHRDTVDFGRIRQGETVGYKLGVRNVDSAAMIILEVLNSCGCTSLEFDKHPLQPGDTASMQLFFDSKGQFGQQRKLIQIVTSFSPRPHDVYILAEVYK